ncbi:MAG TPA: ankyrin repeat domain-containing protein, partial [Bryobacteraceae bacterium]|nr:ankyrin repeat domain-containing protein [Bryobacteraceae bacterium]
MGFYRCLPLAVLAFTLAAADDPDGTTPLHWAVRGNDVDAVQRLLRAGANPDAANRYGVTPLSLAATNASAPLIQALLQAGAHPTGSILMTAARTGNPEIVRMLIARGADANARESSLGETALMWAAAENHPEAVRALIEHGADPNARSEKLTYAKDRFGLEGVTTILPRGSWTALMYAARQGSLEAARALADAGA